MPEDVFLRSAPPPLPKHKPALPFGTGTHECLLLQNFKCNYFDFINHGEFKDLNFFKTPASAFTFISQFVLFLSLYEFDRLVLLFGLRNIVLSFLGPFHDVGKVIEKAIL